MLLPIGYPKTDQNGEVALVLVQERTDDCLCPLRAVRIILGRTQELGQLFIY